MDSIQHLKPQACAAVHLQCGDRPCCVLAPPSVRSRRDSSYRIRHPRHAPLAKCIIAAVQRPWDRSPAFLPPPLQAAAAKPYSFDASPPTLGQFAFGGLPTLSYGHSFLSFPHQVHNTAVWPYGIAGNCFNTTYLCRTQLPRCGSSRGRSPFGPRLAAVVRLPAAARV